MLNLYLVFGSFAFAYVIGCVLLVNNVASVMQAANALPPGIIVKMEMPDPVRTEFQHLEQGVPVRGATLRTPEWKKSETHRAR